MRGTKVRVFYGILLVAVTLWWTSADELSPVTKGTDGTVPESAVSASLAEDTRNRTSETPVLKGDKIASGKTSAEKQYEDERYLSDKRPSGLDNRILDRTFESIESRSQKDERPSFDATRIQTLREQVTNEGTNIQHRSDRVGISILEAADLSTEPLPAESKVLREFTSHRVETAPFVTTARGGNVHMTTSRSTRVEEVTMYDAEDEDDDTSSEEPKEKKKKAGSSKEHKDHTTLRTGKILAGQKPYDISGFSGQLAGSKRKSAFQSHSDYPVDSYPHNGGGVYRKPVTGYYDAVSNSGGRKPSPFDVRKPLYSLDSTYGSGLSGLSSGQRRPSSSHSGDSTTPYIRGRPAQDFTISSGVKNPFLGVNSLPSLSTPVTSSSKRPFSAQSSDLSEGLSAFAEPGLSVDSGVRFRKPAAVSGDPFRPTSLSRPELEGGFKPLLSSNYNELPPQQPQQTLHQVYKQRIKPMRGPQSEGVQAMSTSSSLPPGAFNFNNIGLNMLYKETNVLNNQDFTSNGGIEGGSDKGKRVSSSTSAPVSAACDSNNLESSGTTVSEGQRGSEISGGLVKKINPIRVKLGAPAEDFEGDEHNTSDETVDVTTTEINPISSNPIQTKYKLRKPALLTNITRKGVESNAIPQEVTSRKPVVKNNLKSRLTPSRTKVPSTTSPATTTMVSATTEVDEEMEITTQLPLEESELKPSGSVKPIIGFNQRKRPPGKPSSPVGEVSTTLSPVRVSSATRLRKPTQASVTTELPSPAPVKKIKPFVNWASRLQKVTTTEEDSEEVTVLPDEDMTVNSNPAVLTTSNVSFAVDSTSEYSVNIEPTPGQTASPTTQSSLTTRSTTPFVKEDVTTTAKLFENTIPSNKIGIEEKDNRYNNVPISGDSKKEDSRFTVKDFISKFNEDSSSNTGDSFERLSPVDHSIETNGTLSTETPAKSNVTSTSLSLDSTTQMIHITIQPTTVPNLLDSSTQSPGTKLDRSTETLPSETTNTKDEVQNESDAKIDKTVENPLATAASDAPLNKEDVNGGSQSSSDRTTSKEKDRNSENDKESQNNHSEETIRATISTAIDRELTGSSTVDVTTTKLNDKTNRIETETPLITPDNQNLNEMNEKPSSTEHDMGVSSTSSVSLSSTSEETVTKGGASDRATTKSVQSTEKDYKSKQDNDPWRSNFSDDFWSNFHSTTENWNSKQSKTTLATPWIEEKEATTKLSDSKYISGKDVDKENDNFNTVLSSVSVTPPTEGTTVSMTTSNIVKVTTVPTVTEALDDVSVSMETDKQSPVTVGTKIWTTSPKIQTTSQKTVLPPNVATSSEGDFYSVEDVDIVGPPPIVVPPSPPIEDPKHYIQLAIHSTPADICASLPTIGRAIVQLFQMGSLSVQSSDQMHVKNRNLLCTSPETQESQIFVEFYLTDDMGRFDRDINEEFIRLYSKQGGLDTDLMITEAHLIGEEPVRDDIFITEDTTIPPRPDTPPRVIAAIVIASVAFVCLIVILVLLYIMRKKGRSFNNRQRCIPVSLDDYSLDNVSVYNSTRRKSRLRASKRSYGNPAFDDPNIPTNPMAFAALANFARDRRAIEEEFAAIPSVSVKADELPAGVEDKNRYANVIPIPETRVRLCGPGENASPVDEYINANYVRGPKNEDKFYIACQAPLQNTIEDFWHMIWTHQTKVVLMITGLFENSVEKCADYLPPSEVLDCHRVFGDYQITLKRREVREKYVISSLQIKNLETNLWRELTHVWYTSWPTTGVPSEENSLIAFLIEARAHTKNSGGGGARDNVAPIVIHCSPGTGRTGTVLACDLLIRHFETSREVNVPTTVYNMRRCRAGLVATPQQYAFIYRVLNVYATKLTGGALDSI